MIAVLIDMISIGLIIPVLPALVGVFTQSEAEQAWWYGAVAFAFGFANFIAAPILGGLSDRFGRRAILLVGFCGVALSFFATALASSLALLVLARFIGGAMQANAAVANAYVADITPPEQRARRFGMLGAMFGLGFILGPVMGGLLGSIDLHLPFYVAGTLAVLNALYGYFVLPESLPPAQRKPFSLRDANPVSALRRLAGFKGLRLLVTAVGLISLAQFTMHASWVLHNSFRFGWGPRENGWSLFAVGVMSVLVQGWLLKYFLRWFGPRRFAVIGLSSGAMAYLLWGMATEGWMMYAIIACNVLAFGATAAVQSQISAATDASAQGRTMGAVSALNSLMAALAPALGAPLLALVSHLPPQDWRVGAPLYFCAVLQGLAAFCALRYMTTHRAREAVATP
ncbi:MAG: MFS transporter [Candidatus Dactylopiibacterium sp.]|nr:MFS transporter [Candidatus Dactylopiibacterium sp.]